MKEERKNKDTILSSLKGFLQKFLQEKPFLFSLVLNTILFAFFFISLTPNFNTNDDYELLSIVAGRYGEPSEMMVFTNVIIGKILVSLYKFNIHIPWYSLYLIFGIFISNIVLTYLLFKFQPNLLTLFFSILLSLFFIIINYINIQYTIVAGLLMLSGMSLLFSSNFMNKTTKFSKYLIYFFGSLIFIFGSLIRFENFFLINFLFMSIIIIISLKFFKEAKERKRIIRFVFIFIITICSSYILKKYNDSFYIVNQEFNKFIEYQSYRPILMGQQLLELQDNITKNKILTSVGWSNNDYKMIPYVFSFPNDIYSLEKLEKIVNNEKIKSNHIEYYLNKFIFSLKSWDKLIINPVTIIAILLLLISINIFKIPKQTRILTFFIIWIIFVIILISTLTKPLPLRVFYTILTYLILIPFFIMIINKDNRNNDIRINKNLIIIFTIPLILFASIVIFFSNIYNKINQMEFKYFTEKLKLPIMYVLKGGAYPFQFYPPLMDISELDNFNSIGLGWGTAHPVNLKRIEKLKINDLYLDLINRKDLFLISSHIPKNKLENDVYKTYMKEHYNLDIDYYVLADLRFSFVNNLKLVKPYIKR
ncbi:MAG: hypothetical protein N2319_03890 [Candidatus Kapabacteria bacterium]|nr:hypothetical protein [Candidatus Kapabacteria bacterium]